ncbi:hypothetical protein H6G89_24745 [Oscillatoria sp. FACHB-1407]|uniref:hypothetical protein n=1 Tax=Oscillatoria sp. FACHB-1407 TaxID=2692847 RepID=UPI001683F689|nr:hypothetical protein [Oscillatoria sp. FACHB-1407]MBD2464216.1 hypothetical protein [Oscillatoria sp. FACHB-1407]
MGFTQNPGHTLHMGSDHGFYSLDSATPQLRYSPTPLLRYSPTPTPHSPTPTP